MKKIKNYNDTQKELEIAIERLEILKLYQEEKYELENRIKELETHLKTIEKSLKELSGLEYKLFYEIVINKINITKAVDKVSLLEDKDPSTLWKNYYPKVKKELEKLK